MPRWMHKAWAHIAGYFWLPCPHCGEMFGGHEVTQRFGGLQERLGKMFCPRCAKWDEQTNPRMFNQVR